MPDDTPMPETFLPCPFCGAVVELDKYTGTKVQIGHDDECYLMKTGKGKPVEELARAWNHRA